MKSIQEIKELKEWLVNDHHANRVREQLIDRDYIEDKFKLPHIKEPYAEVKLGTAFRMVNTPANHIITSNPQVYVEAISPSEKARERQQKRGSLLNHWADMLTRQNPQPYKESVKNALQRGEGWIHIVNNSAYREETLFKETLPVVFAVPDPLIIYASPNERNGVPEEVIVYYQRDYKTVMNRYEHWPNPKNRNGSNKFVSWFEYWSADMRYFEADEEPVTGYSKSKKRYSDGQEINILSFVPFVHFYSGYGKAGPEGKPEDLAVSRIRFNRGLIMEKAEVRSSISSQLKLHAVTRVDVEETEAHQGDPEFTYSLDAGAMNLIPKGYRVNEHLGSEPGSQVFQHAYNINSEIEMDSPPILSGITTGSSGRQDDIAVKQGIAQFESVVDNVGIAWSTAFKMGLHVLKSVPGLLPVTVRALKPSDGVKKLVTVEAEDIDDTECEVMLKAKDPIEDKAMALQGNREQQSGIIDWETNLTKYHGFTSDEARDIMNKAMVDKMILSNPILQNAIAIKAMKDLGMEQYLQIAGGQPGQPQPGQPQGAVPGQPGPFGGEPREGNIENDAMYAEADNLLQGYKVRNPPNVMV